MRKKIRRFGWLPDLPDQRDHLYSRIYRLPTSLPKRVDLRNFCSKVEDQGDLGSCTANAIAGALELLEVKDKVSDFEDLSRLFIYYNERVMEGNVDEDAGAYIRDGIKSLVKYGVCSETLWPYNIKKFAFKPTKTCYKDALNHQALSYQRLLSLKEMKACLAEGFPVVFGFSVYESFTSKEVERTGIVPMPEPDERLEGGHAVLAVGYDDSKKWAIVRNSWGESWGSKGYFYMPYDYLSDRNLSEDFWTVRRVENY